MLETNIRIVKPGKNLYVMTRRVQVIGSDLSPDLLERACSKLRYDHGIAAVLEDGSTSTLLVATSESIPHTRLADDEWAIEVIDQNENSERLYLSSPRGAIVIPRLIERALSAYLKHRSDFWSLDSSRIWYEAHPFKTLNDICAYRRYELGAVLIDDVGVGIAVDVGTAFFTTHSLAYYLASGLSASEYRQRRQTFERLTNRQSGQKGTLLYDNGRSKSKCYFERATKEMTCTTTGEMRIKGTSYSSLAHYYAQMYPTLEFDEDGPAVYVSFPGIDRPTPVAAEKLFIRVMNDSLPGALQSTDKITPEERRNLIQDFWDSLGTRPLGKVAPGLSPTFWRPDAERTYHFCLPPLSFGSQYVLPAPKRPDQKLYRDHYRQRTRSLSTYGCYAVPPTMDRVLHVAVPESVNPEAGKRLAQDTIASIRTWTNIPIEWCLTSYTSVANAVEKLKTATSVQNGCVLFVLNDEATAYYDIALNLGGWRIKRLTTNTLHQQYQILCQGYVSNRQTVPDKQKGERRWRDFAQKNALDVIQLLEVLPFGIEQTNDYEAMLAIDVGHDRRHFALSVLVARSTCKKGHFELVTHVHTKSDHQHEHINHIILRDQIVNLIQDALPRRAEALASLLILRDGKICGRELQGINDGIEQLKNWGLLENEARIDLVDLRKNSLFPVRLWDVCDNQVSNPLEGSGVQINSSTVVVTSTGAATLTQGTAEPYLIVGNGHCTNLRTAAQATFDTAQLNYSSPGVAQRLPLPLKRTDEELQARSAQQIRRVQ